MPEAGASKVNFGQVKRRVLMADVMINAIDAVLENRKIVFGVVHVRSAANIFFDCMVDGRMPAKLLSDFSDPS